MTGYIYGIGGDPQIVADALTKQTEHIRAWRWHMWKQGIDCRTNGRRFNTRGEPIDGGSR